MISVIVPVYNAERYLERCVTSILAQTYKDIEVILVDDGSKDGSSLMCDEFAKQDDRIRVFHISNGGVSNARNIGMQNARGDYVAFVDSDDYIDVEMYERLLNKALETDADMVFCNFVKFDADGVITEENSDIAEFIKEKDLGLFVVRSNKQIMGNCYRILFKRNLLADFKFNENLVLGEDLLFVLELLTSANNIAYIPNVLYKYFYENGKNHLKYINNPRYLISQQILTEKMVELLAKNGRMDLAQYYCWYIYSRTVKLVLCEKEYKILLCKIKNVAFWNSLNSKANYCVYKKLSKNSSFFSRIADFLLRHNLFVFYRLLRKLKGEA